MAQQKEKKKYGLGNIYGTRVSKNGKWLNLLVAIRVGEQEELITCPVRISTEYDDVCGKKPYARIEKACTAEGVEYNDKAVIANLPVYEYKKPTEKQAAVKDGDLPF